MGAKSIFFLVHRVNNGMLLENKRHSRKSISWKLWQLIGSPTSIQKIFFPLCCRFWKIAYMMSFMVRCVIMAILLENKWHSRKSTWPVPRSWNRTKWNYPPSWCLLWKMSDVNEKSTIYDTLCKTDHNTGE